jgi:hypothetical protein
LAASRRASVGPLSRPAPHLLAVYPGCCICERSREVIMRRRSARGELDPSVLCWSMRHSALWRPPERTLVRDSSEPQRSDPPKLSSLVVFGSF